MSTAEASPKLLNFFKNGSEGYERFCTERFVSKTKQLSDTITKVNLPKFDAKPHNVKSSTSTAKSATKQLGQALRQIDVARSRGVPMKDILSYDHSKGTALFDKYGLTTKPDKSELVRELEKNLESSSYEFTKESSYQTAAIMDFMSQVRKIPDAKLKLNLKVISDLFESAFTTISTTCEMQQLHIVYDSYLEDSIKECERIRRRSDCDPLEFTKLEKDTPLPVQFKCFWACSKNKENIQLVSRNFFKQKSSADPVKIILSGFVTDVEGIHPCLEVNSGDVVHRADLNRV